MKNIFNYDVMQVRVEVTDVNDNLIAEYTTNLADEGQRRVFAEQMTEAYAAGQASFVYPLHVVAKQPTTTEE